MTIFRENCWPIGQAVKNARWHQLTEGEMRDIFGIETFSGLYAEAITDKDLQTSPSRLGALDLVEHRHHARKYPGQFQYLKLPFATQMQSQD